MSTPRAQVPADACCTKDRTQSMRVRCTEESRHEKAACGGTSGHTVPHNTSGQVSGVLDQPWAVNAHQYHSETVPHCMAVQQASCRRSQKHACNGLT